MALNDETSHSRYKQEDAGGSQKTKTQAFNELAAYLNAHTTNTNLPTLTGENMQQRWRTYKTKKFQPTLKKSRTEMGLRMTKKELRQGLSIQAKLDKLCPHFAHSKYDEDKGNRSEERHSAESSDEHLGGSGSDNNDQSDDADEISARNDLDDNQDDAADGRVPTNDNNEASSKNTGVIEPDNSFEPTPPESALWTTGEEDELLPLSSMLELLGTTTHDLSRQ
ncbi:hypothetical protein PPTG_12221 [Phytophthora nicotianae INRA-310]|uniref:Myb/SANT-like domain-containing protein n=1 Tax=Phytophthora nicotianae (strain INRA-310) TaxID=761204 RepID=W2Q6E0_PHYN3|nr:hypothetical protein PPTG_12221 [Phytophthora nicotianae INRA-310]ETN08426.1 hypothetical protein PPTG_12221 [Phytophthora nicotianae INRA-310]